MQYLCSWGCAGLDNFMAQVQQSYRILLGHKCCGNLLKCKNAESLKTATKIPIGSYICLMNLAKKDASKLAVAVNREVASYQILRGPDK